jgi:hypothetical protein
VNTKVESACPEGLVLVNDTILDRRHAYDGGSYYKMGNEHRNIPRIVHVTSKTRCMAPEFARNLDQWRFANHSFFFHNDEAVERLLNREWPEFPALQQAVRCTKGGAGRADVWRALVIWEFGTLHLRDSPVVPLETGRRVRARNWLLTPYKGGIYTDIDNLPASFDGQTIQNDDEAFFVIERSAILSQYFFAARPRHPLMYLLVQHMTSRLLALNDVTMQIVSLVTGPGALRMAFCNFMRGQGPNFPKHEPRPRCWYPTAQLYTGLYNTTVRVVGHQDNPDEWVARDVVPDKHLIYRRMNMTYFRDIPKLESATSCFQRIYEHLELFREAVDHEKERMRLGAPFY